MKPIIIRRGSQAYLFTRPRSFYSTGRQLHLIYETGDYNGLDSQSFDWPWEIAVGARFSDADSEDMVIF